MSPRGHSLQTRLQAQLERTPGRHALGFLDSRGQISWRTWEEFHGRAAAYAARFAGEGLKQGDACILVLPSEEFCATALMAVLLVGAVPLLVAPPILQGLNSHLVDVVIRTVGKTRARLVVCSESMSSMREQLTKGRRTSRFLFGEREVAVTSGQALPVIAPARSAVAAMQLTSGTTGFPRVCVWKQEGLLAALDGMAAAMALRQDDRCLNWTPLYHDMGLVNNFLLCLSKGVPLVMASPQDFVKRPALWLRGLWESKSTVTWSPNFGFAITVRRVRDEDLRGVRLGGVRAFWNAAERIHLETMRAFHERFAPWGVRLEALKTNFGCAENVGGATFSDPHGMFVHERVDGTLLQRKRIASQVPESQDGATVSVVGVGRPAPAIGVKILSRTGRPLPDGHVGEVALETPSRTAGFLGERRATRRAIYGKLLRTGDLGYLRGKELFWVGRVRERITVRGRKLDPSYLEPILLRISGARQGCFAAFGVEDAQHGTQRLVLVTEVLEFLPRTSRTIGDEIRDEVFRHLGVEVSEVILVRPGTLTKTSSGKRRHRHFRKLYMDGKLKAFEVSDGGAR